MTGFHTSIEMMNKKIYIAIFLILLFISGCAKKHPTAIVGEIVALSAEIPEESENLDFIWELTSVPDKSSVNNATIEKGETSASVFFIPDVPGKYGLEVSVFHFNDEISTQTFSYDIVDPKLTEAIENIVAEKNSEEAISELMAEDDEPKWYESETIAEIIENSEQTLTGPKTEIIKSVEYEEIEEKTPPPVPVKKTTHPPPFTQKKKKTKKVRGATIPFDKERFTIQVGSKKVLEDAKKVAATLIDTGYDAYIQKAIFKETNEIWYRIRVGSYDKRETAVAVAKVLSSARSEQAWVDNVRYEY
jgi:cell division septation protein DedD